jgi:hypothetical protein
MTDACFAFQQLIIRVCITYTCSHDVLARPCFELRSVSPCKALLAMNRNFKKCE